MSVKKLFVFFIGTVLIVSCTNHQREEQLNRREALLLAREKQFALKEAEYQSLLHFRDSLLAKQDTGAITFKPWPDSLLGLWNSKLVCTASDCNAYVVGDQRTSVWEFSNDSTGLYVKVINDNKLVRVFAGQFDGQKAYLQFDSDTLSPQAVHMQVVLSQINVDLLKGTEELRVGNNCAATFSVELARASNE